MALVSYALVTLANLKEVLGITTSDDDELLTNIINRVTDIIESYCNGRRFASTVHTQEEYNGTGTKLINARHFPITAVTSYQENNGTPGTADWDDLQSDYVKYIDTGQGPGQFFYAYGFERGVSNYRFSYTAGYTTIPNDLEEACIQLATWIYNNRKSKGMKSETLGDRSYTREDRTGNIIEDLGIDLILEKYRIPSI